MKLPILIACAAVVANTHALAPPTNVGASRRTFLTKVVTSTATTAAAVTAVTLSPAFAADQYALDLDDSFKKEAPKKKSGSGGTIVGAALGGGLLLSLPFFAPNLARLAGYKNAKIKDKK